MLQRVCLLQVSAQAAKKSNSNLNNPLLTVQRRKIGKASLSYKIIYHSRNLPTLNSQKHGDPPSAPDIEIHVPGFI